MVAPWFATTPPADTTKMLTSALSAPKAALQNFWRNKGLSIFAVSVMFVFSSFLQPKANSASETTIKTTKVFFIQTLLVSASSL